VAVKLIRKERLGNPDLLRRFLREIRASAQLSHPNLVSAYDADQVGDTCFFAMEYVEGTDLGRHVRRQGPLPVLRACDYVYQTALGLQHVHEMGFVHRDLKPSNLMVTGRGQVKILDMGLARLTLAEGDQTTTDELTRDEAPMGTPDYIAPEQAVDSHQVDIRADLYSLGCAFYYLLTGRVPFPGGTQLKKLFKHCWMEPRPVEQLRPDVPPAVAATVRKLMDKRPERRYQTPLEVVEAVSRLFPFAERAADHDSDDANQPRA
jgi:serine/threonine protein kinase